MLTDNSYEIIRKWAIQDSNLKVLYGHRSSGIHNVLETLVSNMDSQIIIIDVNRSWKTDTLGNSRAVLLWPVTLMEFMQTIISLRSMKTSRLKTIIIHGITTLLRDFQGIKAKHVVINKKILAWILAILNDIQAEGISIYVSSQSSGLDPSSIILKEVYDYYHYDTVYVDRLNNKINLVE